MPLHRLKLILPTAGYMHMRDVSIYDKSGNKLVLRDATQSSTISDASASLAIDGDLNTYFHTGLDPNPEWSAMFEIDVFNNLGSIFITPRGVGEESEILNRVLNVKVYIDVTLIYTVTAVKGEYKLLHKGNAVFEHIETLKMGQSEHTVKLSRSGIMNVKDVSIYSNNGTKMALNGATQSGTYGSNTADKGIDSDMMSYFETTDNNSWWTAKFYAVGIKDVGSIFIIPRGGAGLLDRSVGIKIYLDDNIVYTTTDHKTIFNLDNTGSSFVHNDNLNKGDMSTNERNRIAQANVDATATIDTSVDTSVDAVTPAPLNSFKGISSTEGNGFLKYTNYKCSDLSTHIKTVTKNTISECDAECDNVSNCTYYSFENSNCKMFSDCRPSYIEGKSVHQITFDKLASKSIRFVDQATEELNTTSTELSQTTMDLKNATDAVQAATTALNNQTDTNSEFASQVEAQIQTMNNAINTANELALQQEQLIRDKESIINNKELTIGEREALLSDTLSKLNDTTNKLVDIKQTVEDSKTTIIMQTEKLNESAGLLDSIFDAFNAIFVSLFE